MVEKEEYARELRIKRNAELNLTLAKLPPRMQEHENLKKLSEATNGELRSQSMENLFSFMPTKAKPVPDFKRL
jgi:Uncharacterised protein family UPF0564